MQLLTLRELEDSATGRSQRIKRIRKILGLTQSEFASDDLPVQSIKNWESGLHSGLTKSGAKRIIERAHALGLECDYNWLFHGIGAAPHSQDEAQAPPEDGSDQIAHELLAFRKQGNTIDLIVMDEAMLPNFAPGDYVAGVKTSAEKALNHNCIVIVEDNGIERILLRQVLRSNNNEFVLMPLNQKESFLPISCTTLKGLAPVIWHRKPKV